MTDGAGEVQVDLQLDWSDAGGVEEHVATQFLVQIGMPADGKPDGVHLVVGHASPPVIVGDTAERRQEQLDRYGGKLPVTVHGRYFFSRARLEELRRALNTLAAKYDELSGVGEGGPL